MEQILAKCSGLGLQPNPELARISAASLCAKFKRCKSRFATRFFRLLGVCEQNNRYDNAFKAQAVKSALEIGQNKARNALNLPENTLYNRMHAYRKGKLDLGSGMRLQACSLTKDDEPEELRNRHNASEKAYKAAEKKNKSLREGVEFLAEASSFFFAVSRRKSAKARECALLPKRLAAAKRKEKRYSIPDGRSDRCDRRFMQRDCLA